MQAEKMTFQHLFPFRMLLLGEEKSTATAEKYFRDARHFCRFAGGRPLSKDLTIAWKHSLEAGGYAAASINSMLISVNCLLDFMGRPECKVKAIRVQRKAYCAEKRQLTRAEYLRLLDAARGKPWLWLILQTICGTGIRVSELNYFTVEALRKSEISVHCKSKIRVILVPAKLRKMLLDYAKKRGVHSGPVFVTRSGKPLDRSNIWAAMKRLCAAAKVAPEKVFPHNLRKLFARCFHEAKKDMAKLADVLGHSSIETTRLYVMTTGREHRRVIEGLRLIL